MESSNHPVRTYMLCPKSVRAYAYAYYTYNFSNRFSPFLRKNLSSGPCIHTDQVEVAAKLQLNVRI